MTAQIITLIVLTLCLGTIVFTFCRALFNQDKNPGYWTYIEFKNGRIFWRKSIYKTKQHGQTCYRNDYRGNGLQPSPDKTLPDGIAAKADSLIHPSELPERSFGEN
jgi:hypothetical protein